MIRKKLSLEQIEMKKAKWGLTTTLFLILVDGCLENDIIYWKWVMIFLVGAGICLWQFIKWCKEASKNESKA